MVLVIELLVISVLFCLTEVYSKNYVVSFNHFNGEENVQVCIAYHDSDDLKFVVEAFVRSVGIYNVESCRPHDHDCIVEMLTLDGDAHKQEAFFHEEVVYPQGFHASETISNYLDGVDSVLLNIGSSVDPVVPEMFLRHNDSYWIYQANKVKTLAFEPISAAKIKPKPWLKVIPAAVSSTPGLQSMYRYNIDGVSSSLHRLKAENLLKEEYYDGTEMLVPVLTLDVIMASIPSFVNIAFLKTDMQGADFEAVKATGKNIRRIGWVVTEVWHRNCTTYENFRNDFCRDWLPHMTSMGYHIAAEENCPDIRSNVHRIHEYCNEERTRTTPDSCQGIVECDILWLRNDIDIRNSKLPPVVKFEFGVEHSSWF